MACLVRGRRRIATVILLGIVAGSASGTTMSLADHGVPNHDWQTRWCGSTYHNGVSITHNPYLKISETDNGYSPYCAQTYLTSSWVTVYGNKTNSLGWGTGVLSIYDWPQSSFTASTHNGCYITTCSGYFGTATY